MQSVVRVASRESREVSSYRDLRVWWHAMELVKDTYRVLRVMPKEEQFGLTSQMKRAAVSVPSNIAEGSSRRTTNEFIRYVNIATGSLAELETQLLLAQELGFLAAPDVEKLLQQADDVSRMLQGLYNRLTSKTTRLATRDSHHEE